MRKYLAVVFLVSLGAQAQFHTVPTVNLDKPGALASLEKERPDDYRTVLMTIHATERMKCGVDLKAYQAGDIKHACRSHIIRTSYPAQVFLSIPLQHVHYTVTAYLDHSLDHVSPAK